MAKSYQELQDLMAKAKREGVTMSELGRRGGLKAAKVKRDMKAHEEKKKKEAAKPKQLNLSFESFKSFFNKKS